MLDVVVDGLKADVSGTIDMDESDKDVHDDHQNTNVSPLANISTLDDISERIALVTNYLKTETLYAPLQVTCDLVTWKAENRSHRLVVKESDDTAILAIIGVISTDNFFLTPDGYYKGSNNVTPSLADVKLT